MLTRVRASNPVQDRREELGVTRKALATEVRVSKQRILQIEHNERPSLELAGRIADALGSDVHTLFGHFWEGRREGNATHC